MPEPQFESLPHTLGERLGEPVGVIPYARLQVCDERGDGSFCVLARKQTHPDRTGARSHLRATRNPKQGRPRGDLGYKPAVARSPGARRQDLWDWASRTAHCKTVSTK
eukprot:5301019-Prymnesium_polylepis.1